MRSCFVTDPDAAAFVAVHAGAELDITVEAVSKDTLGAREIFTTYGLALASLNGYDSKAWSDDVTKAIGWDRAYKLFDPLEDSLDVDEGRLPRCDRFSATPPPAKPRKTPEALHVKGRFVGFVDDEWRFAVFCVEGDSTQWFGISHLAVEYFVAAHAGAELDLEVETAPEDSRGPTYGLLEASLDGHGSDVWWDNAERALGDQRANKVFSAVADSLVIGNDLDLTVDCKLAQRPARRLPRLTR